MTHRQGICCLHEPPVALKSRLRLAVQLVILSPLGREQAQPYHGFEIPMRPGEEVSP